MPCSWHARPRSRRTPFSGRPYVPAINNAGIGDGSYRFAESGSGTAAVFPVDRRPINIGAELEEAGTRVVNAISNSGFVAGNYQGRVDGRTVLAAFVWHRGRGMQRIGDHETGHFASTTAYGVNRAGHVAGVHATHSSRGYCWSPERGIFDLPHATTAYAVNDDDLIVGQALPVDHSTALEAFIADRQVKVDCLPRPPTLTGDCAALAVNNAGEAVGYCAADRLFQRRQALLWWPEDGAYQAVDLNETLGLDGDYHRKVCDNRDDGRRSRFADALALRPE